jgi:putative FmdB family regulatory protein
MPIYEYACVDCGAKYEFFQGMRDLPLTDCPKCCKPTLQKLISAAGFRLKGGGWYETDFKNDKDKKKNLVDSNASTINTVPVNSTSTTSESATSATKTDTSV